jgi:hypothetical protein
MGVINGEVMELLPEGWPRARFGIEIGLGFARAAPMPILLGLVAKELKLVTVGVNFSFGLESECRLELEP